MQPASYPIIQTYEGYARELFDRREQVEDLIRSLPDAIDGCQGIDELVSVFEDLKEQVDGLKEEIHEFEEVLDEITGEYRIPLSVREAWAA